MSHTTATRQVKHKYTDEEYRRHSEMLVKALSDKEDAETEFGSIKSSYKAKIEEADARAQLLRSNLRNGFEMRIKDCTVMFDPDNKVKRVYVTDTNEFVCEERMTDEDFQLDLINAESQFSERITLPLWEAGEDRGEMVIGARDMAKDGQDRTHWFAALRLKIGPNTLAERLDSEQRSFKTREDAGADAGIRAMQWIEAVVGADKAPGFRDVVNKTVNSLQPVTK